MNKNLYFIHLLSSAAERRDSKAAFKQALSQIRALGAQPDYQAGYAQFRRWFEVVAVQTATSQEFSLAFLIEREEEPARILEIEQLPGTGSLSNIKPGRHRILLHTGMLLWEGDLTPDQLLWAYAFEGEDLPAAAADIDSTAQPTSEISLLDGELILRTYPGPQAGRLEIQVQRQGERVGDEGR